MLEIDPYRFLDPLSPLPSEKPESVDRLVCLVAEDVVDSLLLLPLVCKLDCFGLSGRPSHFEFVFGTKAGSFCDETPGSTSAFDRPGVCAAAFFCASAYCAHAAEEGSFKVRKPRTPAPRFFAFFPSCVRLGAWLSAWLDRLNRSSDSCE